MPTTAPSSGCCQMFSEIYKYIWSTEAAALPLKNCSNGSRTESKTEMLKCWCIISEHWCKRWLDESSIMTHCCNSANVKTLVVSRCSVYLYRDYIRCCWTHLSILYHKHTQTCACVNTHKHTPTLSLSHLKQPQISLQCLTASSSLYSPPTVLLLLTDSQCI